MKYISSLFYLFLISILKLSAGISFVPDFTISVVDSLPELSANCPYTVNNNDDGFIDDDEFEIIQFCIGNRISDFGKISDIVIGEWELVGHGEGWIPSISQPCGSALFSESDLIVKFKDEFIDTTTTHNWTVVDDSFPYIEIIPPVDYGMGFGVICDEFMFSDYTPSDGNMYLYQKKQDISKTESIVEENLMHTSIFPNPTSGTLMIEQPSTTKKLNVIEVYNTLGKSISFDLSDNGKLISVDLTGNARGTYFLIIDLEGYRTIHKILMF